MLAQLSSVKSRLALLETDTQCDALLTNAIKAVSARFDKETNRTLARTVDNPFEFPAENTEIVPLCYPIETVTKFELKTDEASGRLINPRHHVAPSCRAEAARRRIKPEISNLQFIARPGPTPRRYGSRLLLP